MVFRPSAFAADARYNDAYAKDLLESAAVLGILESLESLLVCTA